MPKAYISRKLYRSQYRSPKSNSMYDSIANVEPKGFGSGNMKIIVEIFIF